MQRSIDPQIRKALEHAWKAFEHAGYNPREMGSEVVGAFLTSSVDSYFQNNLAETFVKSGEAEKSRILFLNEPDFLATRLAYQFDWKGPAFTIKCGCSSSLVAIDQACKSLLSYDCDVALSGGAAIKSNYHYGYLYENEGILSRDGRCCPFSKEASGTVFSNGVGLVVLKRLEEAEAAGDTIHGVIRATFSNNDGRDKVGYMAPSVSGQVASMRTVLSYAEVEPGEISYIETHGTGTEVGDPIEFKGLMEVFSGLPRRSIALGAVKGNIGHTDAVSGVAGVIKMLGEMKHKTISPMANFDEASEKIALDTSPFFIAKSRTPWTPSSQKRIAVVSSFGIGGTNAQLVLEEYEEREAERKKTRPSLFLLSAKSKEQLDRLIDRMIDLLESGSEVELRDLCYTLLVGRGHFQWRYGVVVSTREGLLEELKSGQGNCFEVSIGRKVSLKEEMVEKAEELLSEWKEGAQFTLAAEEATTYKRIPLPSYPFAEEEYWVEPGASKGEKIADLSKWFYLPYWKRVQVAAKAPEVEGKRVLLFAEESPFSGELHRALEGRGAEVWSVYRGERFERCGKRSCRIAPAEDSGYCELISALTEEGSLPDIVFHLWNFGDEAPSFEQGQECGLYSLVSFVQAAFAHSPQLAFHLSIVCNGIANVSGFEEVHPAKSTLLGISQVLPKEFEKVQCQLVDISPKETPAVNVEALLFELHAGKSSEVALRGMRRYIKEYSPTPLCDDLLAGCVIKGGGNYLVTGGLGNFGMELSEFIGCSCNARLFLTTRTRFPKKSEWDKWIEERGPDHTVSKKIAMIRRFEERGARIEVVRADVSLLEDVEALRKEIVENYGPLSGVIHAAGIVESGMIQNKRRESFRQVFAAKVCGTENVCKVFARENPDFIILCSSMNSIIGGLGQVDNTAANAYIDAYAELMHTKGHHFVLAINWGAVNEARARNYSALPQFKELSREHIKNKMSKEEIFEVYRRLFSTKLGPRVVVSTIDFNEVIVNWSRVGSLKELAKSITLDKKIRGELFGSDYIAPSSEMEKAIEEIWQELLGIDRVSIDDDFFGLGGNSLVAIQFIGELTKRYPIKIHAMSIYEYPTLKAFASYAENVAIEAEEKRRLLEV